jgi:hypothetical protein
LLAAPATAALAGPALAYGARAAVPVGKYAWDKFKYWGPGGAAFYGTEELLKSLMSGK